jgi:hypothetical protein
MTTLLAISLAACSSNPAPVAIEGSTSSLQALAGKWSGQYDNAANGRSGSIVFNLHPDGQTATGDVMMFSRVVSQPWDPNRNYPPGTPAAQLLSITFVQVSGGQVSGKLDPYKDPDTGSMLSTTFTGRQTGDTIEGTFEAWSSDKVTPQRGHWKVTRRP